MRILDAAEKIYADYGYEGTSLRQIAEVVGITGLLLEVDPVAARDDSSGREESS